MVIYKRPFFHCELSWRGAAASERARSWPVTSNKSPFMDVTIDLEFEFYEFFSFLKFNELYKFFSVEKIQ